MEIIHSISKMQSLCSSLRTEGLRIGFVPTMGALHEGHLSLVDLIKERVDILVLSIFVNPTQFGHNEDLYKYPRDLEQDKMLCINRNVDYIFAPSTEEMYQSNYSTKISENLLSIGLCGSSRPDHFSGVALVCAKLFNICQPSVVAFGQKDAQQVAVIKRMVRDLNFQIDVLVGPIIREYDGLAMSSRNRYLSVEHRETALFLNRSLQRGKQLFTEGTTDARKITNEIKSDLSRVDGLELDYVEIVNRENLVAELDVKAKQSICVVAVWVNRVRLIDNYCF
jgi:pantoate--beta-alanine ligase